MKIRSINELIRAKLTAAADVRMHYALAAADGNSRLARRCKDLHAQYLKQIRILWEIRGHRL